MKLFSLVACKSKYVSKNKELGEKHGRKERKKEDWKNLDDHKIVSFWYFRSFISMYLKNIQEKKIKCRPMKRKDRNVMKCS